MRVIVHNTGTHGHLFTYSAEHPVEIYVELDKEEVKKEFNCRHSPREFEVTILPLQKEKGENSNV